MVSLDDVVTQILADNRVKNYRDRQALSVVDAPAIVTAASPSTVGQTDSDEAGMKDRRG
jgi:hypothetical protein